ncbi:MAG TPA: hypothetical protein VGN95_25510 [Pyrinomonadaceae bacterium]|jgi:hypothetical protein|nr:hypothetical protein [Pyrinomonadaceae bacterium]
MNKVRRLCATTLLTMLLAASSALAGDLPQGVTSPPPPTGNSVTGDIQAPGVTSTSPSTEASVTGNMPMGVTSAIDPATEFTLSLLQSMFSLF